MAGVSLGMLGLTVRNTAGTLDPDLVIENGDTSSAVSVKGFVAGFRDRVGLGWDTVVYAEEVVKTSAPAESIYGPVNDTTTDVITILGVDFDLDTASGISIITLDNSGDSLAETTEDITSICLADLLLCPSNEDITNMAAAQSSARAEGAYASLLNNGSIDGELTLYTD